MRITGVVRLGLSIALLGAVTACDSGSGEAPPVTADVALRSYEPPAGAPGFCTELARLEELDRLPVSIGMLAAGPDAGARKQVSGTIRELLAVLADVRAEGGQDELASALDGLVRALGEVGDGGAPVRASVVAGLEQVGMRAQPACGFPT